jgi:hypothetical protein
MPDDENRVDLNDLTGDLLKDIESMTSAVKQQSDKAKARDAKKAESAKSKKLYLIVAILAAFALLVVAFMMVGKEPQQAAPSNTGQGTMGTNTAPPATNYTRPGVVPTQPTTRPVTPAPIRPQPSEDSEDSSSSGVSGAQ